MPNASVMVRARHYRTDEVREVPAHFVGEGGPFPGQWTLVEEEDDMPPKSARRDAWADYAVRSGQFTEEQAAGMTRSELVAHFTQEG